MIDVASIKFLTERTALQKTLWELPLINNSDVPVALGISQTTWQQLKLDGDAPDSVRFGRRVVFRTRDLRQWVDRLEAKKNPIGEDGVSEEEAA